VQYNILLLVPDPLLLREFGSARNWTQDPWICSQEFWLLDRRGGRKSHHRVKYCYSSSAVCFVTFKSYDQPLAIWSLVIFWKSSFTQYSAPFSEDQVRFYCQLVLREGVRGEWKGKQAQHARRKSNPRSMVVFRLGLPGRIFPRLKCSLSKL
jgi:hypothetical protein